ncbi:TonB-dependent receptor [Dasania sp. GY-MA-18]|uniref:TonB-dependent receptor n=1 Tax=Dasania phycosphaerae TaxID=2950436 RepID=A0A9J6RPZ8_9GAMM|nr:MULTISPECIES: TonB-dependent receptor [Dasania]MCR8924070.1 TonB-dependent receptor [Dasania sp. GY-MA-18]MCZ0866643.1 TonB-dependent receptor [Dasania phycosphaerae]MCZ0870228.1 TonB-dependent receptor [Dasania phycosphaerae]
MYQHNKPALKAIAAAIVSSVALQAGAYQLEEVMVTAQKRQQSAQDVSIAITAFGSESIKDLGMEQPIDVAAQTPGLFIKNGIGVANPYISIRNVGQSLFVTNAAQPVGMYMNEVNLAYTSLMSLPMYDIERIEVLKGPQGTLFGRNSTAGAMSLFSAKPSMETGGEFTLQLGNKNLVETDGFINGPLGETVAGRLAFTTKNRDGFYKNKATGNELGEAEMWAARGSLLWDTSSAVTTQLVLEAVKDRSGNTPWASFGIADVSDPQTNAGVDWADANAFGRDEAYGAGNSTGFAGSNACSEDMTRKQIQALNEQGRCVTSTGHTGDGDLYEGEYSLEPVYHHDLYSAMLNVNYEADTVTLTSVTGYLYSDRILQEEFDGTIAISADQTYTSVTDVFSQELRLSGDSDNYNWVAGIYYGADKVDTKDTYEYTDTWFHSKLVDFVQETTTHAVFGHSEWHLDESWSLIADARYTAEEITFDGGTFIIDVTDADFDDLLFGVPLESRQLSTATDKETTANEITWKLGVDYKPNDDWLIYGFVSRGFKSGGYNGTWTSSNAELAPYDIETLIDYELGFKGTLMDNTLQLNGGVFYYDYQDLQAFVLDASGVFNVSNIPETDIYGAELELWWRPLDGLDLRAGASYTDAEIKKVTADQVANGIVVGNTTANAAEWMFNGLVRYEWSPSEGYITALQTDFNYQDDTYFTVQNTAAASQDGFWLANARASLSPVAGNWEVALWVKNLADKEYVTEMFPDTLESLVAYNPSTPRTYGASFTYKW